MSSAPEAGRPVLLHELPTADIEVRVPTAGIKVRAPAAGIEVHHSAPPPDTFVPDGVPAIPVASAGRPRGWLRGAVRGRLSREARDRVTEQWWRACLVGTAAAILAVGVTAGVFHALGWSPMTMMGMDPSGSPGSSVQFTSSGPPVSVASPAPHHVAGLSLEPASNVAAAESLPAVLSNAEQFFAADAPGVAAVYQQPGTMDPGTGGPRYLTYLGVPVSGTYLGVPVSGLLANPATRLDRYLRSVAAGHSAVSFQPVDTGPGAAGECASFRGDFGQQTECGWTAPGTVGIFTAPARDYGPAQLAALIRQARPALNRR